MNPAIASLERFLSNESSIMPAILLLVHLQFEYKLNWHVAICTCITLHGTELTIWSLCFLQEPRASSAAGRGRGYFTTILTQEADDDLEVLRQQDATPSTGCKGSSKWGSNYTNLEDIQLCKSWIHISNDPIIGNNQPGKTYWERIGNDFHSNRDFESDRTPNSLEHRFGIILKECMKFQGYYEEVERRHPSGIPYKEHVIGSSHTLSLLYILTLLYI